MRKKKSCGLVKTAGQLRNFLTKLMEDVRNGQVDVQQAAVITKTASQVTESLYAEIKVKRILAEAKEQHARFGLLPLGEPDASKDS